MERSVEVLDLYVTFPLVTTALFMETLNEVVVVVATHVLHMMLIVTSHERTILLLRP